MNYEREILRRLKEQLDTSDGDVFVIGRTHLTTPPTYVVRRESGETGESRSMSYGDSPMDALLTALDMDLL